MNNRKKELLNIIDNELLLIPLVEEVIKIEEQLTEVRKLPFYKVNPKNAEQQKMLPAFRIYKELLQQYTNCIKTIASASGQDENNDQSPLRVWVNSRLNESQTK